MPLSPAPERAAPKLAVIVSAPSKELLSRFLGRYVRMPFGLHRCQTRKRYREEYGLTVLSRPLEPGADPQALYGPHEQNAVLIVGALSPSLPGRPDRPGRPASTRDATRAWLAAKGFAPIAELEVAPKLAEYQYIDLGAEVVNFVNVRCPWRNEEIEDIEAYREKHGKAFWE